jgi:hypothetical protein
MRSRGSEVVVNPNHGPANRVEVILDDEAHIVLMVSLGPPVMPNQDADS